MAEEAPAAASKAKEEGPGLQDLIVSAVAECKARKGVSLAALKNALAGKGVNVSKSNKRINTSVNILVSKGSLNRIKGTGASGSFKLAKREPKAAKKAAKKAQNKS